MKIMGFVAWLCALGLGIGYLIIGDSVESAVWIAASLIIARIEANGSE